MPECKKCNIKFPNIVKINGKLRNLQRRKYCIICSPFGLHNTAQLDKKEKITKVCSLCKEEKNKSKFYKKGKNGYGHYCKICAAKVDKKARAAKKQKIKNYAGAKCILCDYNKYLGALEFHHKDPTKKDFQISRMGNKKWEIIKKEIDKCILVCANCHREIHAGLISLP